jgi:glycosyltransferase involved in cell wall biosynthesis
MRIAIVAGPHVPVPPKQYGGTEQVIYHLIRGLIENGHEPILIGTADSEVPCQVIPIADKPIFFPVTSDELPAHNELVHKANKKIEQVLNEIKGDVDLIHSHGFDLKNFSDFPNLTTLHCILNLQQMNYFLRRKNLYYVSISHNQQDSCPGLNYAGVAYNGEDPSEFPVVTEPENYLCFLGRFDRDKNPHEAMELAIQLGMKIKVGGKIDYKSEGYFEQQVRPYFSHPLVEYLGELDFPSKVELLSKARCNIHPIGFREPFGLTVLEAAYCGTPTLAIRRGSMSELIEENRTGKLVEDMVEGYHQIDACFEMDRSYIASRARQLFNYQNMTESYLKAYQHVLNEFALRRDVPAPFRTLLEPKTGLRTMFDHPGHRGIAKA